MFVAYNFAWYRRIIGGRWEKWLHEQGHELWYRHNSELNGRPHISCRGTPTIEIYPEK